MGLLVEGVWHDTWYDTKASKGRFVRSEAQFRNTIEPGGRFDVEVGRYHLIVAAACPWCHRVMIARALFGLEHAITMTVVDPWMLEGGWRFDSPDPVLPDATFVHEVYTTADPTYSGRVTVPILWDRTHNTLVSNESSELIRMLDDALRPLHTREVPGWYPEPHREEIEQVNPWIYRSINNGVYRCGFATTQEAYDEAVTDLFAALERVEARLEGRDFLVGDHPTEADWRLFPTLIRFDLVYYSHFKCNVRRLADFPNLQAHTERLYRMAEVAGTVDFDAIKTHYFGSHETINPHRIIPRGPNLAF